MYIVYINLSSMKKLLLAAFIGIVAVTAQAQISSDTLNYNRGTLGVQSIFPVNTNSQAI